MLIRCGNQVHVLSFATSAQHAWESRQLRLAKTEIDIEFLPAVDTSEWKTETIDQHLKDLEQVFIDALPPEQRPLPEA